jgi:hypothetical protein
LWIHEHTFSEQEGGTLAGDNVVYAVPGGKLVQKLFVAPDLDRIFHYRHEILENILPLPLLSIAYAGRRVGLGSCHQPNTKSHSFRRCSIFQWCYGLSRVLSGVVRYGEAESICDMPEEFLSRWTDPRP